MVATTDVQQILSYCRGLWTAVGSESALAEMEQLQVGFLKVLLGVQVHTMTCHVMAELGRYPLKLTWQLWAAQTWGLQEVSPERSFKQVFIADLR